MGRDPMRAPVLVFVALSLVGTLCVLVARVTAMDGTETSQPTTRQASGLQAVTLRQLASILRHQECDATGAADEFLRLTVPIPSNERKASTALFLILPWAGDKAGISRAKAIVSDWNRPMAVAWSNEHWVVVADCPPGGADEHLPGLTGWITGGLREYRPIADDAAKTEAATRPAASRLRPGIRTSRPAPQDQEGPQAELVFERPTRRFSPQEDITVELRLVNKTRMKQKYARGFGMTSAKWTCQFQVVNDAAVRWSCEGTPDPKWQNYEDIVVEPGQSLTIGKWNLIEQRCSPGYPARTGKAVLLKDVLKSGRYYVRWWDGNFQMGRPLYSSFVKLEITQNGVTPRRIVPD